MGANFETLLRQYFIFEMSYTGSTGKIIRFEYVCELRGKTILTTEWGCELDQNFFPIDIGVMTAQPAMPQDNWELA